MPPVTPRKQPRQERSRATVEAIVQAATQVLMTVGYDRASTNKIAKLAGVSIGSLYQYFPNKEALILEVARRHSKEMLDLLGETSVTLAAAPIPVAVRSFVRANLRAHAAHADLHRALLAHVMHLGVEQFLDIQTRARQLAYLQVHRDKLLVKDLDAATYVLVSIVEGVTHNAVFEDPELLKKQSLEDEVVDAVCRYLLGSGSRDCNVTP